MIRSCVVCAVLLLVLSGCKDDAPQQAAGEGAVLPCKSTGGEGNPFAKCVDAVVEGRKLYLTYGCVGCHGQGGGGGMGKPILDDEWKFGSDDATLFKLIRGEIPNQTMPNAIGKALTDDQIWKVLTFVRFIYQGDKSKINWVVPPPVSPERLAGPVGGGDPIAAGKVLFMAACTPCHGQAGKGDGPSSTNLNPKPRNLTDAGYMRGLDDRYLFELISRGGIGVGKSQQMPQFALSPEDIGHVIAYVRTLSGTGSPRASR